MKDVTPVDDGQFDPNILEPLLDFGFLNLGLHPGVLLLDSTATTSACSSMLGQILNIHISYGGEDGYTEMSELYKTLIANQFIQSLSLNVANHGCVVSGNPFAFSFRPGDGFAPFTALRLDGSDFDNLPDAHSRWHQLSTIGVHGSRRYMADEYGHEWLRPKQIPLTVDEGSKSAPVEVRDGLVVYRTNRACACAFANLLQAHVWKSARNQVAGAPAAMMAREQRGPIHLRLPQSNAVVRKLLLHGYTCRIDLDCILERCTSSTSGMGIRGSP